MGHSSATRANLRSRWLGQMLRNLRKEQGISLNEAADFIQRDGGMLSRYETGGYPIRRSDVMALMTLYGVSDETTRERLLKQCSELWRKGWWDPHADDLGEQFINVPWLESQAIEICSYQNMTIDGLLQTKEYARELIGYFAGEDTPDAQIERWVDLRIRRQRVVEPDSSVKITHILEESVLHRTIGSNREHQAQLKHLLAMSQRDQVELLALPSKSGVHPGLEGSFNLYVLPEPYEDAAVVNSPGGSLYIEPPNTERLRSNWKHLLKATLSPADTRTLIQRLHEDHNE